MHRSAPLRVASDEAGQRYNNLLAMLRCGPDPEGETAVQASAIGVGRAWEFQECHVQSRVSVYLHLLIRAPCPRIEGCPAASTKVRRYKSEETFE